MANRGTHFRVGLLVLGAGTLFLALLAFVLGKGLAGDHTSYFILFEENVKGMVLGSKVNFQGVPFGAVRDIRFVQGRTEVEIVVDRQKGEIQDVTRARLDRLLVTGQVTVELEGWSPEGRALAENSYIQPTADPLHRLTRSLPEVLDEAMGLLHSLRSAADRVDRMLAGDVGRRIDAILTNAERASAVLPERIDRTAERLDVLLQTATSTMSHLDRTAAAVAATAGGADAQALLAEARTALRDLHTLQERLTAVAIEAQGLFGGMRGSAGQSLASLRATLDEARELMRLLRLAPDSLIHGIRRPADALAAPGAGR